MFRGFIAVKVPFGDKLNEFWEEMRRAGGKIKLVEPHNVHITLKFLGSVPEEIVPSIVEGIEKACKDVSPFEVTLKGCGGFPTPKRPRVVWIGVSGGGEILKKIASNLEEEMAKLGFKKERREFIPHLTVGRIKGSVGEIPKVLEKYKGVFFSKFEVKEVKLMKSTLTPSGPIYDVVEVIPLKKD